MVQPRAPRKNNVNPELDEVLARPENQTCADCLGKNPTWASVNLGLFVCLDCSGAHRNLGVHISVVKSATLDKWQTKWIAACNKLGNRINNAYYEKSLSEESRPRQGDLKAIENFVKAKYERRQFAPKGQMAPYELMAQGRSFDVYDEGSPASQDAPQQPTASNVQAAPARRAPAPAPAPAPAAPSVDLLSMDDAPVVSALASARPSEASAFGFLQSGPPSAPAAVSQPPVADLTSQLGSLDLGAPVSGPAQTSAFSFTHAPAPAAAPAFSAGMPTELPAQAQLPQFAQPPQEQSNFMSLQSSLASLYQQPAETAAQPQSQQSAQSRFAALSTPSPAPMQMAGGMAGFSMGTGMAGMGGCMGPSMGAALGAGMGSGMGIGTGMGVGMSTGMGAGTGSMGACMGAGMGAGVHSGMGAGMQAGMGAGMPGGCMQAPGTHPQQQQQQFGGFGFAQAGVQQPPAPAPFMGMQSSAFGSGTSAPPVSSAPSASASSADAFSFNGLGLGAGHTSSSATRHTSSSAQHAQSSGDSFGTIDAFSAFDQPKATTSTVQQVQVF